MAALPPTPPGLKGIVQYLKLGQSLEQSVPVLSYWCRTHALKVACQGLATANDEEKAYIGALMGGLEQDKLELASASFNPDDTATGFKLAKNMGFKYFKKADDDDRAGMASKGTAGTFLHASKLFSVARGLNDDPQVVEWNKYGKYRAIEIMKALKAGRIPDAPEGSGGGGAEAGFEMDGVGFGEPQMPPVGGGGGGEGGYSAPPSMAPVGGIPSLAPVGGGGGGGGGYSAPPSMAPVGGIPSLAPFGAGGGGGGGGGAPPTMPSLPPQSAYPSTALGGSTSGGFTAPAPASAYTAPTPTPAPVQPAYVGSAGNYTAKATLSNEEMTVAKKHCSFALSALQYNDPKTVVDNLLQALSHLTN